MRHRSRSACRWHIDFLSDLAFVAMAGNDDGSDLSCATGEEDPPEQKNVHDENRTSFDGQSNCGLGVRTCALTFLLVFALSVA